LGLRTLIPDSQNQLKLGDNREKKSEAKNMNWLYDKLQNFFRYTDIYQPVIGEPLPAQKL
jgi:hypothetical protein